MIDYELIDKLETGDILVFSGKGFVSNIIKLGTLSKWTHVGIVIVEPVSGIKFLFESTLMLRKEGKSGVMYSLLTDRIEKFKGEIIVSRMVRTRLFNPEKRILNSSKNYVGRAYELNLLELAFAALPGRIPFYKSKSQFCSELVANILMDSDLLSNTTPAKEYTPKDFVHIERTDLIWYYEPETIKTK